MIKAANPEINASLDKGLDFLKRSQLPWGEFKTYVFPDRSMEGTGKYVSTTYLTTYVLYSLGFIQDEGTEEIKKRGISFLLEEMEAQGVWRFFGINRNARLSRGKLMKHTPVNTLPDLDDTACAAYCLQSNGIRIPDNLHIFLKNRNEDGIFQTWILDYPKRDEFDENTYYFEPGKNDICCGVLANILLYLGDMECTALSLRHLCRVIKEDKEDENIPYFPDKYILYYLVSRAYYNGVLPLESVKDVLLKRLIKAHTGETGFKSFLEAACTVCTFLNFSCFDRMLQKAVEHILRNQNENGSWMKERFCSEPVRCYGAEELTTAICMEALARYERWNNY